MTRKEELEERVERLASRFERIGESQAKYEIVEALLQVEREVWEKAAKHFETVMFLYGNDSWRERSVVEQCANWCRDQQQELT